MNDLLDFLRGIFSGGGEGGFGEGGDAVNILDILTEIANTVNTDVDTDIDNTVNSDIDNTTNTDVNTDIDNTTNTDVNTNTDINNDINNTSEGGSANNTTDVNNQIDNTSAGGAGGAGGEGGNANAAGGAGGNAQGGSSTSTSAGGQGGTSNSTSAGGQGGLGGTGQGGAGGTGQGGLGGTGQGGVGQGGVGQGGSAQGGTAQGGSSSNSLTDLLTNVGNTAINLGATDYAADQQFEANKDAIDYSQGIYDSQVNRLEPFRQVGIDAIPGSQEALNAQPQVLDLFDGQQTINPNTNIQGPTAGQVDVNQIDPFDRNSEALRFLQDEQMQAVNNGFAASGKLNSGGRYKALQDRAANVASTYAGQMQNISSAQDQANLSSDSQRFGQDATSAGFNLNQDQANIANNFGLNSQLFNNNMAANNFYQNANSQDFGQFLNMLQLGGNAAAGQAQGMATTQNIGSTLFEDMGDIGAARTNSYVDIFGGV